MSAAGRNRRVMKLLPLVALTLLAAVSLRAEEKQLFNGKDLTGWKGVPEFWSVQDGLLTYLGVGFIEEFVKLAALVASAVGLASYTTRDGLGALRQAPGPIIALAGIDESNAAACLAAGAAGVAVMGEIMRAADHEAMVRRLLAAMASK